MNSTFINATDETHILIANFVVEGEPVSKSRARFTKRGSKMYAYTPQKTLDGESAVKAAYLKATNKIGTDNEAAFAVRATFHNGTRQRRDVDNMVKLILDGLNGVAWPDDNQVTEIAARKSYGKKADARTEVSVYLIGDMEVPKKACLHCGTKFRTYESWDALPNSKKYCKPECFYIHSTERRERVCEECSTVFLAWGEAKQTRFCSIACNSANKRVTVDCAFCQKTFTKQRTHSRAINYCSGEQQAVSGKPK